MNETRSVVRNPAATLAIREEIQSPKFRAQVAAVLPRHLTPERFVKLALLATMRTPKLAECSRASVWNAMMQLSQYGIEPDGRRAHLIPFKRKLNGKEWYECQLIIDYKGLAELVMRSGMVSNLHADVVCENDEFEYDRGTVVRHKIDFRKSRGRPYAAYAIARMKDGGEKAECMSAEEIYAVRDKSSGWYAYTQKWTKESPWADPQSEPEMWKKTAFRRLSKWLPLSPEIRDALESEDATTAPDQLDGTTIDIGLDAPEGEQPDEIPGAESPKPAAQPKPDPKPEPKRAGDPVGDLMACVLDGGHTFDDFRLWAAEMGHIADAESIAQFSDVPKDVAARLLRAKTGMLNQLASRKAAQ